MSASKQNRIIPQIKTLGILAGGGDLPYQLARSCVAQGIKPFVIAFKGQAAQEWFGEFEHLVVPLGRTDKVLSALKAANVSDLVLIGRIRRPSLSELRPDKKTLKFFARVGLKALGDDGLLKAIRKELEEEGFMLHGVQEFLPSLTPPVGPLGKYDLPADRREDVARGVAVLQGMSALDVGQAIIVQDGIILGVEAIEGTDELIKRCAGYKRKGPKPILIKLAKKGQDQALDLPTIGPETLKNCVDAGMAGLVLHAEQSLLLSPEEVSKEADKAGLFIVAIDPEEYSKSYE